MKKYSSYIIVVISIIVLIISFTHNKSRSSVADRVISSGEIRIGYIVYPPLLYKDATTGKLSGVSYDIVEATAKKLNLKTNWVEEVGWGTALEGLKTHRYDMLGTQMWPNSSRAREAVFSEAPFNSVIYPYVKNNDHRFSQDISIVNNSSYTISLLEGEMAQFIAQQDYPLAKTNSLPQLSSYAEVFLNVINGKADITFAEPSTAHDFLKSHPDSLIQTSTTPVRTLGNSFAFAREENSMVSMWNIALHENMIDGTISRILEKYHVSDDYILGR